MSVLDDLRKAKAEAAPDLRGARRQARQDPPRVDRLPPHSPEAEQGVLGCILLSPNESLGECVGKFKSGGEVFYDLRHQTIYAALIEMCDERQAIDLITLQQRLKDKQLLDQVGGLSYLMALPNTVPSAANLSYYADIVLEKWRVRRMIQTCTSAASRLYECEADTDAALDQVEADILAVDETRGQTDTPQIKDLVNTAIASIEDDWQRKTPSGITTGFVDLDKMTNGFQPGDMIVIAARPSVGKTSMAMCIAEHVAVDQKLPVGVFSLEMTAESLVKRMLCSRARVDIRRIREGMMAERDFPKLASAAGQMSSAPLYIDDSSGLSILQLRAKARRMAQQHGIKLFVIDYLQLLRGVQRRADNRQQEVADISSGIKGLAKELKVPIIVLSQLNREPEKRGPGTKPRLADLRESGSIEQDADFVGLLY